MKSLIEKVMARPRRTWGSVLFASVLFGGMFAVGMKMSLGGVFGPSPWWGLLIGFVVGFIMIMIISGLLAWAANLLALDRGGFRRALAVESVATWAIIPVATIAYVLSMIMVNAAANLAPLAIVIWILGTISVLWFTIRCFRQGYGLSKGKAFGLVATTYGLLYLIALGIYGIIFFILSFMGPRALDGYQGYPADFDAAYEQAGSSIQGIEYFDADTQAQIQATLEEMAAEATLE